MELIYTYIFVYYSKKIFQSIKKDRNVMQNLASLCLKKGVLIY